MPTDISKFGKGAIPQPLAIKDYRMELATAPALLPSSYDLSPYIKTIKNQGGSGSCVAQAFSYYAELAEYFDQGDNVQLSARDIYSRIFIEPAGAYLKDGAAKICKSGVVLESDAPSLRDGFPPEEEYMRTNADITPEMIKRGMTYVGQNYVTWDRFSVEKFKQAIKQGNGAVSAFRGNNYAWATGDIQAMDNVQQATWWHCVCMVGWDDIKQAFKIVNSWGDGWGHQGFGWLPYDYITKGFTTNPFTILDMPNQLYVKYMSMIKNLQDKIAALLKLKK